MYGNLIEKGKKNHKIMFRDEKNFDQMLPKVEIEVTPTIKSQDRCSHLPYLNRNNKEKLL